MSATRPEEFTDWASDNTQVTEPAGGLKATGWTPGDEPPAQYFNWLSQLSDRWDKWLAQETDDHSRGRLADAVGRYTSVSDILSSSHNWHRGALSNTGSNGLVDVRYWVVGDDGSGNTAIAYAQGAHVVGSAWADETGSAQAGSLDRCAATGTLCLGVDTGSQVWKLGGSSNANGNSGFNFVDVIYDPTSNLWVACSGTAIYTSPLTGITWTQRYTGAITLNRLCSYGGRLICVSNAGLLYSTTALSWTAGWTDSSSNWVTPAAVAANAAGFWILDTAITPTIFHTTDGITVTEHAVAPSVSPEEITAWSEIICLPGIYMSYDPRDNEWSGVGFVHGVSGVLTGDLHGAISCRGAADAILFGPTPLLSQVTPAV